MRSLVRGGGASGIKQNFIAALFAKLVTVLQQLTLVPLFLLQWGPEYYGDWLVLAAVPTALSMSNLGIGSVAANKIGFLLAKNDELEAASTLYLASCTTALICSAISLCVYAFVLLFGLQFESRIDSPTFCLIVLFGSNAIVMCLQAIDGYWVMRGMSALGIYFRSVQPLLTFVASAVCLSQGANAEVVSVATLLATALWAICYLVTVFRKLNIQYYFRFKWSDLRQLFSTGIGFQFNSLWQVILFQGSTILASNMLGPVGATAWSTLRMLSRSGNQILQLINETVWPELQKAVVKGELGATRVLHTRSLLVSVAISVFCAALLTLFGPTIYTTWTANLIQIPFVVWPVLGIGLVLNSVWWTSSLIPRAYNKPWALNAMGVVLSLLSLVVAYFLIGQGILAFAFGAVAFEIGMCLATLKISLALIDQPVSSFFTQLREVISVLRSSIQQR